MGVVARLNRSNNELGPRKGSAAFEHSCMNTGDKVENKSILTVQTVMTLIIKRNYFVDLRSPDGRCQEFWTRYVAARM